MPTIDVQQGLTFDDFSGGVIDPLAVSDSLLPRNCVRKGINVLFDRPRGAVTQRLGTTSVGTVAVSTNNTIQGVHNFRTATAANSKLYAVANGVIYSLSGSSWSSEQTGLSSSLKVNFLTYLDQTAILNGSDGVRYTAGSGTWPASGGNMDVANWPVTSAAAILNGRIFAIGNTTNPSRLYKSSIVSGGTVSWTSGNGTVDVKPNDGAGNLISITSNGRVILLFKERGMYRYDDNSLDYITGIGTTAHKSVITDDQGVTYFFGQGANSIGLYATTGGYPKKLSRPLQSWIEAIDPAYYASIAGYTNGNKVVWAVGTCVIDGFTYSNVELAYNTADQTWEIYSYADSFRCFSQYITSTGAITVVGGDTDGFIQTIDSGYTDGIVGSTAGVDIFSECNFQPTALTQRSHTKNITEVVTFCKDPQGLNFFLSTDGVEFRNLGSLKDKEEMFTDLQLIRGQMIYPRITAVNNGPPFQFEGYSFTQFGDEGVHL